MWFSLARYVLLLDTGKIMLRNKQDNLFFIIKSMLHALALCYMVKDDKSLKRFSNDLRIGRPFPLETCKLLKLLVDPILWIKIFFFPCKKRIPLLST